MVCGSLLSFDFTFYYHEVKDFLSGRGLNRYSTTHSMVTETRNEMIMLSPLSLRSSKSWGEDETLRPSDTRFTWNFICEGNTHTQRATLGVKCLLLWFQVSRILGSGSNVSIILRLDLELGSVGLWYLLRKFEIQRKYTDSENTHFFLPYKTLKESFS